MNKTNLSPSEWQGYIVSLPTKEERKAALAEVPVEYRKRVEAHVQTVFSIRKYHRRMGNGR